jgi:hypothetical protein
MLLTAEFAKEALSLTTWDVGNQILYDLCTAHPDHSRDDITIAKVWIIGRTYAAAIEPLRANIFETVLVPLINEQGEKEKAEMNSLLVGARRDQEPCE